jgi:hypothetical protein
VLLLISYVPMRLVRFSVLLAVACLSVRAAVAAPPLGIAAPAPGPPQLEEEEELPTRREVRIPCDQVMSRINREIGAEHGRAADLSLVAKRMGTSVAWVERCLTSYGRRAKRPGLESAEGREERLEKFEEDEPEETFPEDVVEPGARPLHEHPEHERQPRLRIPPTPAYSQFKDH